MSFPLIDTHVKGLFWLSAVENALSLGWWKCVSPGIAWGHDLALWAPQPAFFLLAPTFPKEQHTRWSGHSMEGAVGPGSLANVYRADPSYLAQLGALQVLLALPLEMHPPPHPLTCQEALISLGLGLLLTPKINPLKVIYMQIMSHSNAPLPWHSGSSH